MYGISLAKVNPKPQRFHTLKKIPHQYHSIMLKCAFWPYQTVKQSPSKTFFLLTQTGNSNLSTFLFYNKRKEIKWLSTKLIKI
jgi:hypothetical protein